MTNASTADGSPPRAREVTRSIQLRAAPRAVFDWHAREGALERLTPPWITMEVLERTGGLADGTRVTFRIKKGGLAFRWTAEHRDTVPGRQFVDEQVDGPFAHWIHTHLMEPSGDGCWLTDRIEYAPPFGMIGVMLGAWCLPGEIERLLRYRHETTREDLEAHRRADTAPLTVAVTGSSGLLGSALVPFLTTGGHRVRRVVRSAPSAERVTWDPVEGRIDRDKLTGVDAVVHLAGENIAARRWNADHKARVLESRTGPTRLIAETLATLDPRPRVLVSASAIGIYGDRGDEQLTEASRAGDGFLAEVGQQWEAATAPAAEAGIRVVHLRFGIVLSPRGGALGTMLPAFQAGVGGRLGAGNQWMSWISIDDVIGAIHHVLVTPTLEGPVNVVAPAPVTNRQFTEVLGTVLRRPTVLPVPAGLLRILVGDLADEALLASARVVPDRLHATGYTFRHPALDQALRHLLGR